MSFLVPLLSWGLDAQYYEVGVCLLGCQSAQRTNVCRDRAPKVKGKLEVEGDLYIEQH